MTDYDAPHHYRRGLIDGLREAAWRVCSTCNAKIHDRIAEIEAQQAAGTSSGTSTGTSSARPTAGRAAE